MNVHQIAVVVIFCWACIYVCVFLLFRRESECLAKKIKETTGSCQPYLPVFASGNLFEDTNKTMVVEEDFGILEATVLASGIIIGCLIVAGLMIGILSIVGYAIFVFLAGLIPFLDVDGSSIYRYSGKIRIKPLEKLQDEDVNVMIYALGILKSRQSRYRTLAIIVFCLTLVGFIVLNLWGAG